MFAAILAQVGRIPRGKVATYGDVAYAAGFPGAARQVVWALHSSKGLPWHRVVGSGGKVLLPGEQGFEQRMRLQAEGVQFHGQRVAMEAHHYSFFALKKTAAKKALAKKPATTKRVIAKAMKKSETPSRRVSAKSRAKKNSRRTG
jgi:methylated-DNA-protein-cysteine methyltransferase-like protein